MSESVEMYLVMTALLREAPAQPVAVSHLAGKLGVTQVSANEMCHRLNERGLLIYQPYKGVTLTADGEAQAQEILSRRRLWVIFLVENLGIGPDEADELACQLEHITSERLVTALRAFLERAPGVRLSHIGEQQRPAGQPLSACAAGTRAVIASVGVDAVAAAFLQRQGVGVGVEAEVLIAGSDGGMLLGIGGQEIALAPAIAARITVEYGEPDHTVRHAAWLQCSHFWACLRGEPCAALS